MWSRLSVLFVLVCLSAVALSEETATEKVTKGLQNAADNVKGFFGNVFKGGPPNGQDEDYSTSMAPPSAGHLGSRKRSLGGPADPAATAVADRRQIRAIQGRLNALGYDAGVPDGLPGPRTRAAISAFQSRAHLPVTGEATPVLLRQLSRSDAPRATGAPVISRHLGPVEANDYEGALKVDDHLCAAMVDEFRLTSGAMAVIESGVGKVGEWAMGMFTPEQGAGNESDASDIERISDETRVAAKRTNWMPITVEKMYGEQLHKRRLRQLPEVIQRKRKGRVARLYKRADEVLNKLLAQIEEEYPYQFQLFLTNDADVDAEALPGGYIYLTTGTLDRGMVELVLGHELMHVTKRHTTRELQARLIDSVSTVDDIKDLMSERDVGSVTRRAKALEGRILNYSRQQELQADACAVRLAQTLPGFDTAKQIDRYIRQIGSTQPEGATTASLHPSYPDRKSRIIQAMQAH